MQPKCSAALKLPITVYTYYLSRHLTFFLDVFQNIFLDKFIHVLVMYDEANLFRNYFKGECTCTNSIRAKDVVKRDISCLALY